MIMGNNGQQIYLPGGAQGVMPMQMPTMQGVAQQPQSEGPPTGLIGSEMALQGGSQAALEALLGGYGQAQGVLNDPRGSTYNMGGVTGAIGQGVAGFNPFVQPGSQAINLQAALSGAMGAPAQQQAYANYQESPGQAYLRQQSEQALLRNSAALGGLGGGRVRQELQRQAQGLASQDFGASFDRLGGISQMGLNAAGQQGQLYGQQAAIAGNLEGQAMGNTNARQLALAGYASGTGNNAADLAFRTGQSVATGRTNAGNSIADSINSTISALSKLSESGGQDVAATIETGSGNLANVINTAGTGQAGSQTDLAKLLQTILASQGNQAGGLPGVPGTQQTTGTLGNIGNLLQGVGAVI
jgi:hypothetical protein